MNTCMEQFAEAERWIGRGQHGLESPSRSGVRRKSMDLSERFAAGAAETRCLHLSWRRRSSHAWRDFGGTPPPPARSLRR